LGRSGIEMDAGLLDLAEEAEGVFAEDFADVGVGVTLLQEGFGDLGEMRGVFHAEGHHGAVEVGAQADMIDAGDFYGVIDVLDDFGPVHAGKLAGLDIFADDLVAGDQGAALVIATAFFDFGIDFLLEFGVGGFDVAEFLAQKADVVINLDDAAVFGEVADHVIGHVAGGAAEGAAGGMGSEDRSFRSGENVVKSFVADVRDVHDDAEAIHFADDILAEIGEAVVLGLVRGGIGPIGVAGVGEGHVANTEGGEGTKDGEIIAHHVAAFNADEGGDFVLGVGGADLVGGGGEDEIVGMLADGFADGVDLIESLLDGLRAGDLAGNPDGEEESGETAIAHARDVNAAVGVARAEIEFGIEETLGGVVVGVDDDGGEVEGFGFVGDGGGGHQDGSKREEGDEMGSTEH